MYMSCVIIVRIHVVSVRTTLYLCEILCLKVTKVYNSFIFNNSFIIVLK